MAAKKTEEQDTKFLELFQLREQDRKKAICTKAWNSNMRRQVCNFQERIIYYASKQASKLKEGT